MNPVLLLLFSFCSDENHWLYVAEVMMKGSDSPVGSRLWYGDALNADTPMPAPSGERQTSASSTSSAQQLRFGMDIDFRFLYIMNFYL